MALSMPACAEINNAMQELAGVQYATSEQHKDVPKSRQACDLKDTTTMLEFLISRNPFNEEDPSLHSIVTGVNTGPNVNVDASKEVGDKILKSMVGKSVQDMSFKRKDQAITPKSNTGVKNQL